MKKLLVFDLDECLVSTAKGLNDVLPHVYGEMFDCSPEEANKKRENIYKTHGCAATYFAKQNGHDQSWIESVYADTCQRFLNNIDTYLSPCAKKQELLSALVDDGWALGILTQARTDYARAILKYMALDMYFDENLVIGRTCLNGANKRSSVPFDEMLSRLDFVPERKIMLDDLSLNLKMPKDMGFEVGLIGKDDTPQSWMDWHAPDINTFMAAKLANELERFLVVGH